jgi:hypothetical protein
MRNPPVVGVVLGPMRPLNVIVPLEYVPELVLDVFDTMAVIE